MKVLVTDVNGCVGDSRFPSWADVRSMSKLAAEINVQTSI